MRNLLLLLLFAATGSGLAQTNVAAGNVYGTWKKTGSPYKINGQISVPKDSTLHIEAGVKVEFQGAYMMHVYGSIQALGKTNDTVVFTPANKSTGWKGFYLHKNKAGSDSNLFKWCIIEFVINTGTSNSRGAMSLDTVSNVAFYNCTWKNNKAVQGSCFVPIKTTANFQNCSFLFNYATSTNSSVTGSGGSVMNGGYSTISFKNCLFYKNISRVPLQSDDSLAAKSTGVIMSGTGNLLIDNCKFIENHASGHSCLYISTNSSDNISITNTTFDRNFSCGKTAVYFSTSSNAQPTLTNLIFKNNIRGNANAASSSEATSFNSSLLSSTVKISNSNFIFEHGRDAIQLKNASLQNCKFIACDSEAIYLYKGTISVINSQIVNNRLGVKCEDGSNAVIVNSTIVNNGDKKHYTNIVSGGIGMQSASTSTTFCIYNSIIQNNFNFKGMANLVGGQGGTVINTIKNSIVQGGTDSAKYMFGSGTITATTVSNLIKDTVRFVKAPKGIGPAGYDSTADFHYLNTCSYTYPGWNQALNSFTDSKSGITINFANTTDLDGNPRIKCGTIDIGPYELEGSKQTVSIDQEPTDQKVCPKTAVIIATTACGASLGYQWQKSTTSATAGFANIGSATAVNYTFTPKDSGWYRLIINQAECSKKDTSIAAKISFKPGSSIVISAQPRDTSICANTNFNLNATVQGSNNTSRWQNSKTSATTGFTDIAGANSNPYSKKIVDSSWYRLIVKNTICNYEDTTKAAKVNKLPLPTPNLGADQTLANSASKVLNPGTFTTYLWSHPNSAPATTPTLTVDKNNLIVGANKVWVEVSNSYGCKGRDTINITLEAVNGVLNPASAGIGIYPVPMQNQLHITLPEGLHTATYQISNMAGQVLVNGVITQTEAIDVSSLSAGSYILTLQVEGRVYGVKVVK